MSEEGIRLIEKERNKEMDTFYARREKETTVKRDEDRNKFFEKIRNGFGQNPKVAKYYNHLYSDLAMRERQLEEHLVDIHAREKYLRELEEERRKLQEKEVKNHQTISFIKNQMDERSKMKRELHERDTLETMHLTDRAVGPYQPDHRV